MYKFRFIFRFTCIDVAKQNISAFQSQLSTEILKLHYIYCPRNLLVQVA